MLNGIKGLVGSGVQSVIRNAKGAQSEPNGPPIPPLPNLL